MRLIKFSILIISLILQTSCYNVVPIERTSVIAGVGHDIIDKKTLSSSFEFLVFSYGNTITKTVSTEKGISIFEMYNKRLLETKRTHLPGTIRLLIISEDRAKFGIKDIIDVFLRDQDRNLNTTVAICKENTSEILNMTSKEATTMSEEIEDLIKSSYETNFTQRDTNIKDLYNMRFQEGRRIMLPYIEKHKDTVRVTSIAVFENDKMIFKIPEEDVKYINLLRNNNSYGYLTFKSDNSLSSVDFLCRCKRKVNVQIENNEINYNIKIYLNASLKEANIDKIKELDKNTVDNLQNTYSEELKLKLKKIIEDYQNNFGVDVFDIEKYALAKLGKDKEDYVKDKFKNSKINVDVKISTKSIGRLIR